MQTSDDCVGSWIILKSHFEKYITNSCCSNQAIVQVILFILEFLATTKSNFRSRWVEALKLNIKMI